jgi:hypothetical protein
MESENSFESIETQIAYLNLGSLLSMSPSDEEGNTPICRTAVTASRSLFRHINYSSPVDVASASQKHDCSSLIESQNPSPMDLAIELALPDGGAVLARAERHRRSVSFAALDEASTEPTASELFRPCLRRMSTSFTDGADGRLFASGDTLCKFTGTNGFCLLTLLAPINFTNSPMTFTRPASTGSVMSTDSDLGWNVATLLKLSDTARAATLIPEKDLEVLDQILEVMLFDEQSPQAVDLQTITEVCCPKRLSLQISHDR